VYTGIYGWSRSDVTVYRRSAYIIWKQITGCIITISTRWLLKKGYGVKKFFEKSFKM